MTDYTTSTGRSSVLQRLGPVVGGLPRKTEVEDIHMDVWVAGSQVVRTIGTLPRHGNFPPEFVPLLQGSANWEYVSVVRLGARNYNYCSAPGALWNEPCETMFNFLRVPRVRRVAGLRFFVREDGEFAPPFIIMQLVREGANIWWCEMRIARRDTAPQSRELAWSVCERTVTMVSASDGGAVMPTPNRNWAGPGQPRLQSVRARNVDSGYRRTSPRQPYHFGGWSREAHRNGERPRSRSRSRSPPRAPKTEEEEPPKEEPRQPSYGQEEEDLVDFEGSSDEDELARRQRRSPREKPTTHPAAPVPVIENPVIEDPNDPYGACRDRAHVALASFHVCCLPQMKYGYPTWFSTIRSCSRALPCTRSTMGGRCHRRKRRWALSTTNCCRRRFERPMAVSFISDCRRRFTQ